MAQEHDTGIPLTADYIAHMHQAIPVDQPSSWRRLSDQAIRFSLDAGTALTVRQLCINHAVEVRYSGYPSVLTVRAMLREGTVAGELYQMMKTKWLIDLPDPLLSSISRFGRFLERARGSYGYGPDLMD